MWGDGNSSSSATAGDVQDAYSHVYSMAYSRHYMEAFQGQVLHSGLQLNKL